MREEANRGRHSSGSSFPFIPVGRRTLSHVKTHQPIGTFRLTMPVNSGIVLSESASVQGSSSVQETETGLKLDMLSSSMTSFAILTMSCSQAVLFDDAKPFSIPRQVVSASMYAFRPP